MERTPLVSVICLCYNHERFVEEAIESVFNQTYSNIELIVVDDASTDSSVKVIKEALANTNVEFVEIQQNMGNTGAFNEGFRKSKGKYVIDLAADDFLVKDRIEKQHDLFQSCEKKIGVVYSDACYVDENGSQIGTHFSQDKYKPHTGDVYEKLICEYFIPPPSMMIKREALEELDGYDDSLAYEDFDFWVRSSRNWLYAYQPEALTMIRKTSNSLSSKAYTKNDKQLMSTFRVCQKIRSLNKTNSEQIALQKRLEYEIKHSVFSGNFNEAKLFLNLYRELKSLPVSLHFLNLVNKLKIDFSPLRNAYLKLAH